MPKVSIDHPQVDRLIELLKNSDVPLTLQEGSGHSFQWTGDQRELANAYFAIVAICHQTSPIGERGLQGYIDEYPKRKIGWDYLKEKFLTMALREPKWTSCDYWKKLTANELSEMYKDNKVNEGCIHKEEDPDIGRTLNRINERVSLINDLGNRMTEYGCEFIDELFNQSRRTLQGEPGFFKVLEKFQAYKDPVKKKSLFFLSIVKEECGWKIKDEENLFSPVDYHEMRGHLRIGTLLIDDADLSFKVQHGLAITEQDDIQLRSEAQKANQRIAEESGLDSSRVHYLFWNVFRNCCPRDSGRTHCSDCGDGCRLPEHYKAMPTYEKRCIFSKICQSVNKAQKVIDPPYTGTFY
jgi:hypothetical protein